MVSFPEKIIFWLERKLNKEYNELVSKKNLSGNSVNWFSYVLGIYVLIVILVRILNPPQSPTPIVPGEGSSSIALEEPNQMSLSLSRPQPSSDQEIIRRSRVVLGGDYLEDVFFQDGQVIARQRISANGVDEKVGEIPDGKIKFFDESNGTYGEEYYHDGKKSGLVRTYYNDGRINSEAEYYNGSLLTKKEYYKSGIVRFTVDYADALYNKDEVEVGVGKVYFSDGTLKYEWSLTRNGPPNFKKSYNRNGELTLEINYDEEGRLLTFPQ